MQFMVDHRSTSGIAAREQYMPQLDAVRAVAICLVLVEHFTDFGDLPYGLGQLWLGGIGVHLFFVLSGFLITRILLLCRDSIETGLIPARVSLRQFYARRVLRIFPLYYALIAAGLIADVREARLYWPSLATFTFNSTLAQTGWLEFYTPFWSLAIEEQFYLVWPCCIFFLPRRWMYLAAAGLVLIGAAWRLTADLRQWDEITRNCATLGCVDLLGAGALLALVSKSGTAWDRVHRVLSWVAPAAAIAAFATLLPAFTRLTLSVWLSWATTSLWAVVLTWVVSGAARGFSGITSTVLNTPAVQYVGRISYGIYACHLFVAYGVARVLVTFRLSPPANGPWKVLLMTAATIAVASLSWHWFEAPINRFKRRFPYIPQRSELGQESLPVV